MNINHSNVRVERTLSFCGPTPIYISPNDPPPIRRVIRYLLLTNAEFILLYDNLFSSMFIAISVKETILKEFGYNKQSRLLLS